MVTKAMSEKDLNWMVERNLRLPREHAATLLYNHSTQDWRDLIPRINIPTLVVGGRTSVVPWKSQVWIHDQIPGSRLEIFEENEGGQHFMFIEGAEKFNKILAEFIG
jgi:pimeloyl-ACP methyl ester carboxylesterase